MGDTKTKTKAAMLNELESIKGLLLEADDIPILQEVIEQHATTTPVISNSTQHEFDTNAPTKPLTENKTIFEEQQDFFNSPANNHFGDNHLTASGIELLDTLSELEKHTAEVTAGKFASDGHKHLFARPSLAKATGENPFLPEHIRARLHGNNPPPLFENETARKISNASTPSRQLGNTFTVANSVKVNSHQQDIIDSIIDKLMPDIEKELRFRLELMGKNMLDELDK